MMMTKAGNGPATRAKVKAKVVLVGTSLPQYEEEVDWKHIGTCRVPIKKAPGMARKLMSPRQHTNSFISLQEMLDEEDKGNADNQCFENKITANNKQASNRLMQKEKQIAVK
eukprot:14171011-Ditylum_brightwellii.AAC.1